MGTFENKPVGNRRGWIAVLAVAGVVLVSCLCVCIVLFSIFAINRVTVTGQGRSPNVEIEWGSMASSGEEIFVSAGCSACHSLNPGDVLVGPSLSGIGQRAGAVVPGMSAEEYIRASILDPGAYVVDGFSGSLMPGNYDQVLSAEQLETLVKFLLGQ
jgi:cytochrome c551/c552